MDLLIIKKQTEQNFVNFFFCREDDLVIPGNTKAKSRRKVRMFYPNMQEIYYDTDKKSYCVSVRALARNIDAHPQTITNILKPSIKEGKIEVSKAKMTNFNLSGKTDVLYESAFPFFLEQITYNNRLSDTIKAKTLLFWVNFSAFKQGKYLKLIKGRDFELDHVQMSLAPENRRENIVIQK